MLILQSIFHKRCLDLQQSDDRISNQSLFPKIRFDKTFFAVNMSLHTDSSVVQSVERRTVNPYVTGSSPVRGAKFKKPAFRAGFLLFRIREIVGWQLDATPREIKKALCHQRAFFAISSGYSLFASAFLISPITFSFLEISRRSLEISAFLMM